MMSDEDMREIMNINRTPGVSIAFINNFKIRWTKCYRVADSSSRKRVTSDTIFFSERNAVLTV